MICKQCDKRQALEALNAELVKALEPYASGQRWSPTELTQIEQYARAVLAKARQS